MYTISREKTALAGAATPRQDLTATPVWRWSAMADRTFTCARCGQSCTYVPTKGRPRLYCSPTCKVGAYDRRQKALNPFPHGYADCELCASNFARTVPWARFCSKECQQKAHGIVYRYGMTLDEYKGLLAAQGGTCAVEGCGATDLAVDHDHRCCPETGRSCGKCVRGLLCGLHNRILGFIDDDLTKLSGLTDYLTKGSHSG